MGTARRGTYTQDVWQKGGFVETDKTIRFDDGRVLGYDDLGHEDGFPVLFFHGTPGSRRYWSLAGPGDPAEAAGVRLIAVDRPGVGLSTPEPQRSIGSFAFDVSRLADALELDRFAVLGFSGGAPYALACAAHLPHRIASVGLVAPMGDFSVPEVADSIDGRLRRVLSLATETRTSRASAVAELLGPDRLVTTLSEQAWAHLPLADRTLLRRPDTKHAAQDMLQETLRQGIEGARLDIDLMGRAWDFSLEEVAAQVTIFTGEKDTWSTIEMSRWLASEIDGATMRPMPSEGHFTVLNRHAEEVLRAVIAAADEGVDVSSPARQA
jgi:pimeloyl-ACP methyl ester carboxylesterase